MKKEAKKVFNPRMKALDLSLRQIYSQLDYWNTLVITEYFDE